MRNNTIANFNIPENVSVEDFFKNAIPKQFKAMIDGTDMSALAGKELKLQFNVDGKKYCLNIKNGVDVEIIEGGTDKPALEISIGESDWRDAVNGKLEGVIDRFTDPSRLADSSTLSTLLGTTGLLNVNLKKSDGAVMPFSMYFNGGTAPEATISLALEDWVAMQKGDTDGSSLLKSGKMSFRGDMMFLINLQNSM